MECFSYDAASGELRWKERPLNHFGSRAAQLSTNRQCAGKLVGDQNSPKGYVRTNIAGATYSVHRIVWKLLNGADPDGEVDHRDRAKRNNAGRNLRVATRAQNCMNKAVRHDCRSGFKGVGRTASGRWRARIHVNGREKQLGLFETAEAAAAAYRRAAANYFGDFAAAQSKGAIV